MGKFTVSVEDSIIRVVQEDLLIDDDGVHFIGPYSHYSDYQDDLKQAFSAFRRITHVGKNVDVSQGLLLDQAQKTIQDAKQGLDAINFNTNLLLSVESYLNKSSVESSEKFTLSEIVLEAVSKSLGELISLTIEFLSETSRWIIDFYQGVTDEYQSRANELKSFKQQFNQVKIIADGTDEVYVNAANITRLIQLPIDSEFNFNRHGPLKSIKNILQFQQDVFDMFDDHLSRWTSAFESSLKSLKDQKRFEQKTLCEIKKASNFSEGPIFKYNGNLLGGYKFSYGLFKQDIPDVLVDQVKGIYPKSIDYLNREELIDYIDTLEKISDNYAYVKNSIDRAKEVFTQTILQLNELNKKINSSSDIGNYAIGNSARQNYLEKDDPIQEQKITTMYLIYRDVEIFQNLIVKTLIEALKISSISLNFGLIYAKDNFKVLCEAGSEDAV